MLKKRDIKGASPEPYVTILNETADRALLECAVKGAFPKPTVEWKNRAGKVLPYVVTHKSPATSKDNKDIEPFYITLQTYVTQTGHYNCVATQGKIHHRVFSTIFVRIDTNSPSGANTGFIAGWTVAAIVSVVLVAVV